MKLLKTLVIAALFASPAMAQHQVTLNWQAPPDWVQGDSYAVMRSQDNATWTQIGTVSVLTYADTDVKPTQTYYYEVVHVRASDKALSLPSNEVTATIPLAPPTNVKGKGQ